MIKDTKLCPLLDYKSFEKIFGNVQESEQPGKGDEVLDWYSSVGKEKLRNLEWEPRLAKRLGITFPDTDELDDLDEYFSIIHNQEDEAWLNAAKQIIAEDLDTDLFRFAGMGSAKVCLYAKNGMALKFGRNGGSLQYEIKNNQRFSRYQCIPEIFDYDEERMMSYMCEFARESVQDDFRKIYGVSGAREFFKQVRDRIPFNKDLSPELLNGIDQMHKMIDKLSLIDVDGENNLGLIVRNGVRQIILIDYDL